MGILTKDNLKENIDVTELLAEYSAVCTGIGYNRACSGFMPDDRAMIEEKTVELEEKKKELELKLCMCHELKRKKNDELFHLVTKTQDQINACKNNLECTCLNCEIWNVLDKIALWIKDG